MDRYYDISRDCGLIVFKGFGDEIENDRKTVDQLVKTLKDEIKYLHTFVLVFNKKVFVCISQVHVNLIFFTG